MDKPIIKLENLSKDYIIYKTNHQKVKSVLLGLKTGTTRHVLKDINLEIMPGEKVAIIGTNGAGRTTLLKIIAGITPATEGKVTVNAIPNPMLDLKSGFDMGLSGRSNITMKASILGWNKAQIREHTDELISFAGIENFADLPMKTYAHGMSGRLGFAMHTCLESELFLMDENFAVGNPAQREKCFNRLEEYVSNPDMTFIMVSRIPAAVRRFCTRGIVLHEGQIVFDGPVDDALKYYRKNCKQSKEEQSEAEEMENLALEAMRSEEEEDESEEYGI